MPYHPFGWKEFQSWLKQMTQTSLNALCLYWVKKLLFKSFPPFKPGKPNGIQWSERQEKKEKLDPNIAGMLTVQPAALPLARHGMCNYSTIKVPLFVFLWTSRCLMTKRVKRWDVKLEVDSQKGGSLWKTFIKRKYCISLWLGQEKDQNPADIKSA